LVERLRARLKNTLRKNERQYSAAEADHGVRGDPPQHPPSAHLEERRNMMQLWEDCLDKLENKI
jgi:hypothetical protein